MDKNISNRVPDEGLLPYLESFLTAPRRELFLNVLNNRTKHLTVVLENVFHPHNASAVLRSCECFGIQDVHIVEKHNKYEVSEGVVQGADKWLDLHYYREEQGSKKCIDELHRLGYKVFAATPHHQDMALEDFDCSQKAAFVFGAESGGISREVMDLADGFMKIPMFGFTESFNVSVAVAVTLHHLTWKLHQLPPAQWKLTEKEIMEKRLEWTLKSIRRSDKLVKHYYEQKKSQMFK